jgi:hypothetical protein
MIMVPSNTMYRLKKRKAPMKEKKVMVPSRRIWEMLTTQFGLEGQLSVLVSTTLGMGYFENQTIILDTRR